MTYDLDEELRYVPKRDYASIFRRGFALLIDSFLILLMDGALFAMLRAIGIEYRFVEWYYDRSIDLAIAFLYFTFMDSNLREGTIGKQSMDMRVVDVNDEPLPLKRSAIRSALKICFGFLPVLLLIAAFTKYRQAIHDMIVGSYVMEN